MSAPPWTLPAEDRTAAYARLLEQHWSAAGDETEEVLEAAYQMGRALLGAGVTLLELSEMHHRALAQLATRMEAGAPRLLAAGRLLQEVEGGYEMLLRGYHDANAALRRANEHLEDQIEQIARALHDESGQLLAAVMIRLDQAVHRLPAAQQEEFAAVRKLLDDVEFGIRRLAHEMHPALLADLGLRPALEFLADGVAGRSGLHISVEGELPQRLPRAVELCLYRCAQETLNNVVRHAQASRVRMHLQQRGGTVELQVSDDGRGFAPPPSQEGGEGMGLNGMRERLRGVEGELEIETQPGAGVQVHLRIPVPEKGGLHGDSAAAGR
ncbi:MAG: sensor histidine kinase [Acidobacteria bacterium]|nr:MAG: sensor histidine kinase [Acidobacteriota bacterium]